MKKPTKTAKNKEPTNTSKDYKWIKEQLTALRS